MRDPAFLAFQLLARQARREILRAVAAGRNSPRLVRQIRAILERYQPQLAAELRGAQVKAYADAAKSIVLQSNVPATRPYSPLPPRLADATDRGAVWPTTVRAVEAVRRKVPLTTAEFDQLDADAKKVAFTVARVQSRDAVERVQAALADDLEQGGTLAEFRERVGRELNSSGLGDHHIEGIYRTHVGRAQSAGKIAVYDFPAVRSAVPYLTYSATHDSRVRPEHLALETLGLDGTAVYRADDPFWDLYYPPWAWNCRCEAIPTTVRQAANAGVKEAQDWIRTGNPPAVPSFVKLPGFPLPKGWVPTGRRLTLLG